MVSARVSQINVKRRIQMSNGTGRLRGENALSKPERRVAEAVEPINAINWVVSVVEVRANALRCLWALGLSVGGVAGRCVIVARLAHCEVRGRRRAAGQHEEQHRHEEAARESARHHGWGG
jgi:hypothetical protein